MNLRPWAPWLRLSGPTRLKHLHIMEVDMAAANGRAPTGRGCGEQFEFAPDILLDGFERRRQQGWTSARAR